MSRHIEYYIGKTHSASCGMTATVMNYYPSHTNKDGKKIRAEVDIKFEDGTIREKISYEMFRQGEIAHPNIKRKRNRQYRIGEKRQMSNGMIAEIIVYRGCRDIDVKFEDGLIIKHVKAHNFDKGCIRHPHKPRYLCHIGEKKCMNCGMTATIIASKEHSYVDVEFENGTVVTNRTYNEFTHKRIKYPVNPIGQINIFKNGLTAVINQHDKTAAIVDIQFEDGITTKISMTAFKKGSATHPTLSSHSRKGTLFHIQIEGIAYQLQQSSDELPTTYFNYTHPETKESCIGTVSDIHQVALNYKQIPEPQLLVFA